MIRLVLILLISLVAGCNQRSSPQYLMDEYLLRISRVTDQEIVADTDNADSLQLPPLKLRSYPLPDIRMKALDALDLLKCPALSQTVARRNSSLGKQMLPSQRLNYEKELINRLSDCIRFVTDSGGKPETVKLLREIALKKVMQLPAVRWNALFTDTELTRQLSGSGKLLSLSGDNGRQGSLEALHYLAAYLPDNSLEKPYTQAILEQHLQQLLASRYSGQLLASAQQLIQTLNQASWLLETRLEKRPVCPQGRMTPVAQRLQNVFRLFYAGDSANDDSANDYGIQPFLAQVHRQGKEWRAALARVLRQLPPAPTPEMQDYLDSILSEHHQNSQWLALERATARHTRAWQKLLSQCGLMPGQQKVSIRLLTSDF